MAAGIAPGDEMILAACRFGISQTASADTGDTNPICSIQKTECRDTSAMQEAGRISSSADRDPLQPRNE
jgi:hypothetical protein